MNQDLLSAQEVVQSCTVIIDQKHKGEITMAEAIVELLRTLPAGGDIHVFSWYIGQLAEAEHEQATTLKRGNENIPQNSQMKMYNQML